MEYVARKMNSLFLNVRMRNSMNFLRASLNGGWEMYWWIKVMVVLRARVSSY